MRIHCDEVWGLDANKESPGTDDGHERVWLACVRVSVLRHEIETLLRRH
jgi:hypothetical protein